MQKSFKHYHNAGSLYNLTPREVATIVKKYNLEKRKIYGQMAVESNAWHETMEQLGIQLQPDVILLNRH